MVVCGCWVVAGSRPIPQTRWISIIRALTVGRLACHLRLRGATSLRTPMAQITSGYQAVMPATASHHCRRWKSSSVHRGRLRLLQLLRRLRQQPLLQLQPLRPQQQLLLVRGPLRPQGLRQRRGRARRRNGIWNGLRQGLATYSRVPAATAALLRADFARRRQGNALLLRG